MPYCSLRDSAALGLCPHLTHLSPSPSLALSPGKGKPFEIAITIPLATCCSLVCVNTCMTILVAASSKPNLQLKMAFIYAILCCEVSPACQNVCRVLRMQQLKEEMVFILTELTVEGDRDKQQSNSNIP